MTLLRFLLPILVVTGLVAQAVRAQNESAPAYEPKASAQQEQKADTPPPQPEPPPSTPPAEPQPTADNPSPPAADRPDAPNASQDAADPSADPANTPRDEGRQDRPDTQQQQANPGISTAERDGRLVVSSLEPRLAQIGLRRDDVIVEFDGQPVTRSADFTRRLIAVRPGARVPIIIVRGGVRRTIYWSPVVAFRRTDPVGVPDGYIDYEDANAPASNAYLGVTFNPRYPNAAVILSVAPGSPAEQAGLQPGDVIVRLDGQRVRNARSLSRMVSQHPVGAELELQFSRLQTAQVHLGERPNATRVEASRVPYDADVPPVRDGRLFDGDGRLIDRRAPTP